MDICPKSLANPNNDLIAMIRRDVPIACLIGSFVRYNKAGIMRNPPPAPTNPVIPHTINPSPAIKKYFIHRFISFAVV